MVGCVSDDLVDSSAAQAPAGRPGSLAPGELAPLPDALTPDARLSIRDSHAHRDGLLAPFDLGHVTMRAHIVDQDDVARGQ